MRYHWGLGVGHFHAHQAWATATSSYTPCQPGDSKNNQGAEPGVAEESDNRDGHKSSTELRDDTSDVYELDNSELGLDLEGWEDVDLESDGGSDSNGNHGLGDEDEEEFGGI